MLPAPDMPHEVPACLLRRSDATCDSSRARAESLRKAVRDVVSELGTRFHAPLFDPFETLCDVEFCPARKGSIVLYSDSHHFSLAGSQMLAPAVKAPLLQLLEKAQTP